MTIPPGNSLDLDQGARVAEAGSTLDEGLLALVERIREELDYNDAKGTSSFRLGVHDGLRFAEDALIDLLAAHGHAVASRPTEMDA